MAAADHLAVVLVRHGLTAWNREKRYLGHRDVALLAEGESDLAPLRATLAGYSFDAIYCSDLTRCRQTLARVMPLAQSAAKPQFDARLRELDFGDYEGKCYAELQHDPGYRAWIDSQGSQAPPGGEAAGDFHARVAAVMDELLAMAKAQGQRRVLIVTHGGVIRSLRQRHEGLDFWAGGIGPGEHHTLAFIHRQGEWQCSCSSVAPSPASAPQ